MVSLEAALGRRFRENVRIQPSSPEAWEAFWASSPKVVAIDVEGSQQSPPALIQIATADLVILEAPIHHTRALSPDLTRLLADDGVVKVFCDGPGGDDKKSLGLPPAVAAAAGAMTAGPVVELEHLASDRIGNVGHQRGFAKILSTCHTSRLGARIAKDKGLGPVFFFASIEQGFRAQLGGLHEIPRTIQEYAALDAWATLLAWVHLSHGAAESDRPAWSQIAIEGVVPRRGAH